MTSLFITQLVRYRLSKKRKIGTLSSYITSIYNLLFFLTYMKAQLNGPLAHPNVINASKFKFPSKPSPAYYQLDTTKV